MHHNPGSKICMHMGYENFQMAEFPFFMTMQMLVIRVVQNMRGTGVVSYVINSAIITVQQLSAL